MWTANRLLSLTALLGASLCLLSATPINPGSGIQLGFVQFETLEVSEAGGKHLASVVVRVTNPGTDVRSFGISNEAGVLGMPLPPGPYCYDAFSRNGASLAVNRQPSERCFSVKANETLEVGVGVRQ